MRQLTHTGRENFAACVAMIVVTTVLMLARFAVRASNRQKLLGSDWTCLLSLAFFYAYCGVILNFILHTSQYGSLDASVLLGIDEMRNILKMTFIAELLMGMVITSVKISILWFYYKAFVTGQDLFKKRLIQGTMVACLMWFIGVTFFIIFNCHPINAFWDMFGQAPYCMSSVRFLLGYEISNLFLDVFILAIPIPILMKLQMHKSNKLSLLAVFSLGTL
ncbi:hypothetical protein INS49_009323 [Diaporthe citri]|uniref:uncharacterized protein n=1 Tax=Diaporthe citri TaxID=83186 RepID=UPI001C810F43|nr:uncharacterized protein INS49_009323 [Diaporthe citri]KAG6361099.1 hypothetical protein INS49_009323 [Diaporthe citri]